MGSDRFDGIATAMLDAWWQANAAMIEADLPWLASLPCAQRNILTHDALDRIAAALRAAATEERAAIRESVDTLVTVTMHIPVVIERVLRAIDSRATSSREPVRQFTAQELCDMEGDAVPFASSPRHMEKPTLESVKSAFERLSDEDRESFVHSYCSGCGGPRRCQCQNDE